MLHSFLEFQLDEDLFELRSQGEVIATQARVFALIAYLLQQRARVVSKEELARVLWKGVIVSDTAISQVVMLARKALRDEGDRQQIIKTVRGRGFRFIARVESGSGSVETDLAEVVQCDGALKARCEVLQDSALLDRSHELDELSRQLEAAARGRGELVFLSGEPGIGKTALVSEFARQASARGADVLWGRAWEDEGAPPFWPWIQVLRALSRNDGLPRIRSELGRGVHALTTLLPELASSSHSALNQEPDGPRARFRQFDAIASLLRAVAANGGTRVIILDDLHAADEASVQLLRFLSPQLPELGVLFVVTFRDLELVPGSALAALVDGCASATHLRLRGIRAAAAATLLERTLGHSLPERDVGQLFALSAGNPLLLAALGQHFEATDTLELCELAAHPLPERMASAVQRHLAQLPEPARMLLSAASALGREFSVQLLARLHDQTDAQVLELLEPARRRAIVREAAWDGSRLVFAHALVCHAIYRELSTPRRIELHRRIAELLEASSPPERLPLFELAHHYHRAAADGCRAKAIDFARRAAAHADGMSAYETAASLYDRALTLSLSGPPDGELWHGLCCSAGHAYYRAGQLERAAAAFDRAAELARRDGHAERYAWAVVYCCSALRGSVLFSAVRQAQLREAQQMLPCEDSPVRALTMAVSMLGERTGATLAKRREVSQAAVDMARRLGDQGVLQWTLDAQHLVLWGAAPEELQPIADEIVALTDVTGDHELMLDGLLWQMADSGDRGDVSSAICASDEYVRRAEQFGSPWHRYMALGSQCFHATCQGEFARALELSEQIRKQGVQVGEVVAEGFYAVRRLFFALHLGSNDLELEPPSCVPNDYHVFWALPSACSGQPQFARRTLAAHTAANFEMAQSALHLPSLAALAQIAVPLGERGACERLYQLLSPAATRHLNIQPWVYLGPVSYYLGLLAHALGETARAAEHFEHALSDTVDVPAYHVYAQYELGRLLLDAGEARGRQLLMAAELSTGSFGMGLLRRRVRTALNT